LVGDAIDSEVYAKKRVMLLKWRLRVEDCWAYGRDYLNRYMSD
jgi:hypothetical protein